MGENERFGGPRHGAVAPESHDKNNDNIKRGHF
jgi:hypothetical protein